jgi:hypothetical protein
LELLLCIPIPSLFLRLDNEIYVDEIRFNAKPGEIVLCIPAVMLVM